MTEAWRRELPQYRRNILQLLSHLPKRGHCVSNMGATSDRLGERYPLANRARGRGRGRTGFVRLEALDPTAPTSLPTTAPLGSRCPAHPACGRYRGPGAPALDDR